MTKHGITVIIVTRNRPSQIYECLQSLLKSSFHDFTILVADQSTDAQTAQAIRSLQSQKITRVPMTSRGKSKGLNVLIRKSKTELLAFTDDDCIVPEDWLGKIAKRYADTPSLSGVFGNTYPYQPALHPSQFCPAQFHATQRVIHTYDRFHYYAIGLGNNMSLRKSAVVDAGLFAEWLGPGTPARNGEESEMIFRMFKCGHTVMTDPSIKVFHNRWLRDTQARLVRADYTLGFIYFLSFYLHGGDRSHAWKYIRIKADEKITSVLKQTLYRIKVWLKDVLFVCIEGFAILRGMVGGFSMGMHLKRRDGHKDGRK